MLHQTPAVESFNRIGSTTLGPKHLMVFLDQLVSTPPFEYQFILAVFDLATQEPVYFVASEKNPGHEGYGGPSHFLSVYDKPGHMTLAASDEFAIADNFFPEAMRIAAGRFGVDLRKDK